MKQTTTSIHANIEKYVMQEIGRARKSIYISMAWFTAKKIQQALLEKKMKDPKVLIEIVVDPNPINEKYFYNKVARLQEVGIVIHKKLSKKFLHVKKIIIDTERVMTGSYNFTEKAKNNTEMMYLIKSKENVAYELRIFRTYTIHDYIDVNIDLLCRNISFAQRIVSAYFPFSKNQFAIYNHKITLGECFTAPNGLYDEIHYQPGFIFNSVCKRQPIGDYFEFEIPITRKWLEDWHTMRGADFLHDSYREIYGSEKNFWHGFTRDMNRNAKAIETYFTKKLEHVYSVQVLQRKIDQEVDVIMESSLWDLNFMPFMTKYAIQKVMAALPEVIIKRHWPQKDYILQRK